MICLKSSTLFTVSYDKINYAVSKMCLLGLLHTLNLGTSSCSNPILRIWPDQQRRSSTMVLLHAINLPLPKTQEHDQLNTGVTNTMVPLYATQPNNKVSINKPHLPLTHSNLQERSPLLEMRHT